MYKFVYTLVVYTSTYTSDSKREGNLHAHASILGTGMAFSIVFFGSAEIVLTSLPKWSLPVRFNIKYKNINIKMPIK